MLNNNLTETSIWSQTYSDPTVKEILSKAISLLEPTEEISEEFRNYRADTVAMAEIILMVISLASHKGNDLEGALEDVFEKRRQEFVEQRRADS